MQQTHKQHVCDLSICSGVGGSGITCTGTNVLGLLKEQQHILQEQQHILEEQQDILEEQQHVTRHNLHLRFDSVPKLESDARITPVRRKHFFRPEHCVTHAAQLGTTTQVFQSSSVRPLSVVINGSICNRSLVPVQ